MSQPSTKPSPVDSTEILRGALKSQYHASLAMLKDAVERCPDELWASRDYLNPFWRIAYHTLYFTHLYLQPKLETFRPWEHHQTGIHDMDDAPAPPEILEFVELPHRPPQTGKPYTKAEILSYWNICDQMINDGVDALDLNSPESGFYWYEMSKAEHQLVNIRHIQHHTAQLMDRLRQTANIGIGWVGARGRTKTGGSG
ncbi:MAG: DinB family protein [candidate division Zixibacteria bacterium]|nr:DinB family protein [candidate division Zixibacteria bacterium]